MRIASSADADRLISGCGSPHQRMRIASSADADRLIKGLEKVMQGTQVEIGLPAAKRLPFLLRKYG